MNAKADIACKDASRIFYGNSNCDMYIIGQTLTQEVIDTVLNDYAPTVDTKKPFRETEPEV
ncbi:hypothetical protein JZU51_01905, partial [bacterium]|nr:hypothetical protein [bacterium]